MLVNEQFLKAKKDKNLSALIVKSGPENGTHRNYMYLCIDERSKYTGKTGSAFIDTDTEIIIDNYSGYGDSSKKLEVATVSFYCDVIKLNGYGHILTFLNAINKNSQVKFRVVAYNGCDYYKDKQIVRHQLYGLIDERCYLLCDYVGADNTASPIQNKILFNS